MRATISELAGAVAQALANELQKFIADMVAKRIIDALELIEVEAEDGQALAALTRLIS